MATGRRMIMGECSKPAVPVGSGNTGRRKQITILDGGMGHLLRRNGVEISGEVGHLERFLGVAAANKDNPELVMRAHLEFLQAGASVIITNNYACIPKCLELLQNAGGGTASGEPQDYEVTKNNVGPYIEAAGQCARDAIQAFRDGHGRGSGGVDNTKKLRVAGSLPPLTESYQADKVQSDEILARDYAFIAEAIEPNADLFVCETMTTGREALAAAQAAARIPTGKPIWVSYTLADDISINPENLGKMLRSGEFVQDAVNILLSDKSVRQRLEAILINCSSPEVVSRGIVEIRESLTNAGLVDEISIGAYANGFVAKRSEETVHCHEQEHEHESHGGACVHDSYSEDLTPEKYAQYTQLWVESGATIIGGCCGVFPEHVKQLHNVFSAAGALAVPVPEPVPIRDHDASQPLLVSPVVGMEITKSKL